MIRLVDGCRECDVFFCFSITETISESLESLDAGEIRVCVCVCVCVCVVCVCVCVCV